MAKKKVMSKMISSMIIITLLVSLLPHGALLADTTDVDVEGLFYEWDDKGSFFPFSSSTGTSTSSSDTYGDFFITGDMESTDDHNGVTSYLVKTNMNVTFTYEYDDSLLVDNTGDEEWHVDDVWSSKLDNKAIELDDWIRRGAIIIQSSLDGDTWITDTVYTDVFEDEPNQSDSIYSTNDVQLLNGTYFRFIVVYRMEKEVGKTAYVFSNYDYKEYVEVYEVYLESELSYNYEQENDNSFSYGMECVVNAGSHNGFDGNSALTSDDYQYGWSLGSFSVVGWTDKVADSDGDWIYLKNVGDRVALNFNLEQDINCLNGNDYLTINRDMDGTDSYFQTTNDIDFERGALMIRYTDINGVAHDQIYTNYLEANTRTGADTRVYLFEEGDYEVVLDYEICSTKYGVPGYKNYKLSFSFSIRNGNCMVFPLDYSTGSELDDLSVTPNGFILDLAGSRYLHMTVTYFVLNDSGDGLDQRYSKPASSFFPYIQPGIYKIHVTNDYAPDTKYDKIICVGNDPSTIDYFNQEIVPNPDSLK